MKTWKKIWKTGVIALAAMALLSGCEMAEMVFRGGGEKEYGKAETMVILSTEKLRYEELYTDRIWDAAVTDQGNNFETVLIEQVHDFLRELKYMSQMADEKEITLTSRENERVKEAASRYYDQLGGANAESFGLEKQNLEELYKDYWQADKLVDQMTDGMNLEVSDSEAKVIEVAQIEVSDRSSAEEVLEEVLKDGADFHALAKVHSESTDLKIQLHRGMTDDSYEDAAYALGEEEISGIVESSGKYYILKCVDDYNEEATKVRKEEMVRQRKNEAFHSGYQVYKADKTLVEDAELWAGLSMDMIPDTEADFFAVFEEVCLEQVTE